ncbi:MAG: peptidoglycan-binding protein [Candidatus Omnitrophica bacterium]|nr:peptidoglycan-binding protein [Candidatus Omnitrophota bacterium]
MKKILLFLSIAILGAIFFGCGKKKEPLSKLQEPVSPEILSQITTNESVKDQITTSELAHTRSTNATLAEESLEIKEVSSSGSYKPTIKQIQTALRNGGYYDGQIDGIIGPKTRKAIESFQKDNGLKVDGIVGPKTWEKLKKYLEKEIAP